MSDSAVRPSVTLLTEEDAREVLSHTLVRLCSQYGPKRVGKSLGIDDKTVRRARDELSTLRIDSVFNLLALDPHALDNALGHFGRRSAPIGAVCDTDALPAMTGAVHKLALATAPGSVGGAAISRCELLDAEPELRKAHEMLSGLLNRVDRIKQGKAA